MTQQRPQSLIADTPLLLQAIILMAIGTVFVMSTATTQALQQATTSPIGVLSKQVVLVVVALGGLWAAERVPLQWIKRPLNASILMGFVILLLLLVLHPKIGVVRGGARRWLGKEPFMFQPSELAKIALVIVLAVFSERIKSKIQGIWHFLFATSLVLGTAVLVAKEDLGTSIVIVSGGLAVLCIAGARARHMCLLIAVLAIGVAIAIMAEGHRSKRIGGWLDLWIHPYANHQGVAYQGQQGLLAFGLGGVGGVGIMRGSLKYSHLPAAETDFVFASIGEETGLWGTILLTGLFLWMVVRGLTVAHKSTSWFSCLLASGLSAVIGAQALLNMLVATSMLPCTGVPLPFISFGGTSLVFTSVSMGLILNVSRENSASPRQTRNREDTTGASDTDGRGNRRAHLSSP